MQPLLSLAAPVIATAALLLVQVLVGEAKDSERFAVLGIPMQQVALAWITIFTGLLAAAGWRLVTQGSWSSALRLRRSRPVALISGVLAGGALWILVQWVIAAQRGLLPPALLDRWDAEMFESSQQAFALLRWDSSLTLATSLLVGAFAPAFVEELMCRGLLVESATQSGVPPLAIAVATAIIFAAIHFSLPLMLPMTVLGIGLGYLSLRSGSVLPAMLAHATFNTITILLLPSTQSMVPVNSLPLLLLAILAGLGFMVLLRVVKRYGNTPAAASTVAE